MYKEIKTHLVERGIPEKEIAFIHSYNTELRKLELFRKFNSGEVRVLIGSTFKLGIGSNVQMRLKAIHHLDVPWRPADMVQREGRILRKGNINENIDIYRYISEGSFDSYSWQILETKQRFISQFLAGSSYQRTLSDLEDNVLTYAEVKALALSEPLMKRIAEAENEVKNLRIVVAKEKETMEELLKEKKLCSERDEILDRKHDMAEETLLRLNEYNENELNEAMDIASGFFSSSLTTGNNNSCIILGFEMFFNGIDAKGKKYIGLKDQDNDEVYQLEIGESLSGNLRRLMNYIKRFSKIVDEIWRNQGLIMRD